MGSAPKGHSGGIAGMGSGNSHPIPAAAFSAARRYHTGGLVGLKQNEVPIIAKRGEAVLPTVRLPDGSFGVRSTGQGGGGTTMFAPQIGIKIDASGRGPGGGEMTPEQQTKLAQMLDEEMNMHLQRKLEEWMRPGGPLYAARR
jgi:phage-related minor tail protein